MTTMYQTQLWCIWEKGGEAYFLKSVSSLNMSSSDSLLLSCLYRAEKRELLSKVPDASLNTGLQRRRKKKKNTSLNLLEKEHISVPH